MLAMKKLVLLLLILAFNINLQAQTTFQLKITGNGSDNGIASIQNDAGNYVVLGFNIVSSTNYDYTLFEVSAAGVLIKQKKVGTSSYEIPKSICKTSDGNYIVSGAFATSLSDYDWFITKIDTGFNTVWFKHVGATGGNDYANKVIEMEPGKYAASGTIGLGGSAKPSIVYFDDNGTILSEVHLNTNQFASPNYKASYLNDGTFGFCNLTNAVCIVDTLGTIIRNDASNFGIYTRDFVKNNSGGYSILALSDFGSLQGAAAAIAFYDSVGSTATSIKKYKSISNDFEPIAVLQDAYGNYYIACNANSLSSGNPTSVLIKTDSVGTVIWSKKYTPTSSTYSAFSDIIETNTNEYLLTGYCGSGSSQSIFIVKVDTSGNSTCNAVNYPLTTSTGTSQASTVHSLFTGTTSVLTPFTPTSGSSLSNLTSICSSVGLDQIENSLDVLIYPNPASQKLNIEHKIFESTYATIFSVEGKKIFHQVINQQQSIDVSLFTNGIYLLQITNEKNEVLFTKKFTKE
jgi:hypothetical protein